MTSLEQAVGFAQGQLVHREGEVLRVLDLVMNDNGPRALVARLADTLGDEAEADVNAFWLPAGELRPGCRHVTFRFLKPGRLSGSRIGLDECVREVHPTDDESDPHRTHDGQTWFDPPEPEKPRRKRQRRRAVSDDVYS